MKAQPYADIWRRSNLLIYIDFLEFVFIERRIKLRRRKKLKFMLRRTKTFDIILLFDRNSAGYLSL